MSNIFFDENTWINEWERRQEAKKNRVICKRCLYDEYTPSISFDSEGVCNYCRSQESLEKEFPGNAESEKKFEAIVEKIKKENKDKDFDVVIGVSGGCDSSYLLHLAKQYDLRALAVHFNNTYNAPVAENNIKKLLNALHFEMYSVTVDPEEFYDVQHSFLKAGVMDIECPTDIALASVLNSAAEKFKVRYIFEGHSLRTEGLAPLGWVYMDSKYIQSIQAEFGSQKIKTLPQMLLSSQLKWMLVNKLTKIRPLWYLDYQKEQTKEMLKKTYGWEWYGGHHLENKMTSFVHTYFFPRRFDIDTRSLGYSALVRSGQMTREEGLNLLREAPKADYEAVDVLKERLHLDDESFLHYMTMPKKTYKDYKTYKKTFERMRPFFYLMAKAELIPWSFYVKYTSKNNI